MFIEADIDFELKKWPREDQELSVLGMMMISYENYEIASTQLKEEDFVSYREFFKALCQLYREDGCANFDSLADLCEELGIIKKNEPKFNGKFREIIFNEGLQTLVKMVDYSNESYDVLRWSPKFRQVVKSGFCS